MNINHQTTLKLSGEIIKIMGLVNVARLALGNTDEEVERADVAYTLAAVSKMLNDLDTQVQNFGFKKLEAVA